MKPDWKDAPEWANWLAMDVRGKWAWFETEPMLCVSGSWFTDNKCKYLLVRMPNWKDSKEGRPK